MAVLKQILATSRQIRSNTSRSGTDLCVRKDKRLTGKKMMVGVNNLPSQTEIQRGEWRISGKNEEIEEAGVTLVSSLSSTDAIYHPPLQVNK